MDIFKITKEGASLADRNEKPSHDLFVQLSDHDQETLKLLRLIEDIKADLLMRADIDSDGVEVVNLSDHIWHSIKIVTEDG